MGDQLVNVNGMLWLVKQFEREVAVLKRFSGISKEVFDEGLEP